MTAHDRSRPGMARQLSNVFDPPAPKQGGRFSSLPGGRPVSSAVPDAARPMVGYPGLPLIIISSASGLPTFPLETGHLRLWNLPGRVYPPDRGGSVRPARSRLPEALSQSVSRTKPGLSIPRSRLTNLPLPPSD